MADEQREDLMTKRKKLRFRAWHRGTKEADLMMGRFADAHVDSLDETMLEQFEALLGAQDLDVYNWIIGKEPVPPEFDNELMALLLQFDFRLPGSGHQGA